MSNLLQIVVVICLVALCGCRTKCGIVGRDEFRIRDPFVLVDDGRYFLYESKPWWGGREVLVREGADLDRWSAAKPCLTLPDGFDCDAVWAPEVHKYGGEYWLFVTLTQSTNACSIKALSSEVRNKDLRPRGTWAFKASSPCGPFFFIKDGPVTPREMMTLDGTLYVEDGRPYMVYCHEWCQMGNGTIEYAPLTEDFASLADKPRKILDARSAMDGADRVTDGVFLYRSTKSGRLYLIWSNLIKGCGYSVLIRRSESGKIAGPWSSDRLLFKDNGGHAMIFRDISGRLLLTLHGPEKPNEERMRLFELHDDGEWLTLL